MSKKGFTLTEMLAVIVLLGILMTFTVVSVAKIRENSINNLYNDKIIYVETASKEWGNDNLNGLSEGCTYVSVNALITWGYISGDNDDKSALLDPRNNGLNLNNNCVCVKYTNIYKDNENISTNRYEVTSEYTGSTCGGE